MGERLRSRPRAVLLALAGVIAAALGLVASSTHVTRRPELASVDARFSVRGKQAAPKDVVIVGIDARSRHEQQLSDLRGLDARVVNVLHADRARVIALDIELSTPSSDIDSDNAIFLAVKRAGNVVLASSALQPGGRALIFGGATGAHEANATASSSIIETHGGTVRRLPLATLGVPSFAVAVAQVYGRSVDPGRFAGEGPWVDFAGPPGTVREVSFADVLHNRVPARAFAGKIVVVGATDPAVKDLVNTPTGDAMAGAEFQANAVATILAGFPLRDPAGWLAFILTAGAGIIVPATALRFTGLKWLPVPLVAAIGYAVVAQLSFDGGTVLPVAAPALALIVGSLGTLAIAYTTDVRDRRRLRAAFARFVPPEVVDEVVEQSGGTRLGGTLRDGTVLFCDLRGFTTLTEQIGAPRVIDLLNRYLTEMSDALLEHGGTVVSYMGDGIMAVFGAPLPTDDHADRALAAAREMLGVRLASFNGWLRAEGIADTDLRMGVGICTGPVMSGNVGSPRRLEYTAVGDTTNTASRLQGMTKDLGVSLLASDATRVALQEGPRDLRQVGTLEVRGRSAPIVAWTIGDDDPAAI